MINQFRENVSRSQSRSNFLEQKYKANEQYALENTGNSTVMTPEESKKISFFDWLAGWFKLEDGSLRGDIADVLAETRSEKEFSLEERAMLDNILHLREVRVEDVMIPRADIEAIEIKATLGELMGIFEKSSHSRIPVYSVALDNPLGMLHMRDIFGYILQSARSKTDVKKSGIDEKKDALDLGLVNLDIRIEELGLIRKVLFAPPSMPVSNLMARMQESRTQMALVIDEYGGTDGLVSFEDLLEMVVGNIEDEHDNEAPRIIKSAEGVFLVDAKADIQDVLEALGPDFSAGEHGEHVDTIGGVILNALGRVPVRGEVIRVIPGFELHIMDADLRCIKSVRIVHIRKQNALEEKSRNGL